MKILCLIVVLMLLNCTKAVEKKNVVLPEDEIEAVDKFHTSENLINENGTTIKTRIKAPQRFSWISSKAGTFGHYLENFPLKKPGSKILKFDGTPIATQNLHASVFDIDTGSGDLQQCADAIIRLRAEFLKKEGRENEIEFHYTSGHLLRWDDYKNGHRLVVKGNTVSPAVISVADESANSFQNYLKNIFTYAGTISINRETTPVTKTENLQTGDILITAGSPGHVVFITGTARNPAGEKLFLLAQGFMPAQSIHILTNPFEREISPWYRLDADAAEINTARYLFKPVNFRRY